MVESFGQRLHRLRLERGMRLRDLGKSNTIAQYEAGLRTPRQPAIIFRLACVLNVSPDVLLEPLDLPPIQLTAPMRAALALAQTDVEPALQRVIDGQKAAMRRAATGEVWGWSYTLSRIACRLPGRLAVGHDGRLDPEQTLAIAAHWFNTDRWALAAMLLESLQPLVPPASPFFGRLAHNTALAYMALGSADAALWWCDQSAAWGAAQSDAWWQVLVAGIVAGVTCDLPAYADRFAAALHLLETWRPHGTPDPLVATWAETARATAALTAGDGRTAAALVERLIQRLDACPAVQPELTTIRDVQARVVAAVTGSPSEGLALVDQALYQAGQRGDPGYALIPAWITSVELALSAAVPDGEERWMHLEGYFAGLGATGQVDRLARRTGRQRPRSSPFLPQIPIHPPTTHKEVMP